jgi:hypothetical protein
MEVHMKTLLNYAVLLLTAITFLGVSTVHAQEWTKDQQEVWQVIETAWEYYQVENYDAAFESIHEKYLGWNHEDPLPTGKAKWMKTMETMKEFGKLTYYDLDPARILVYDNVAVVHYYFTQTIAYTKDGETTDYTMKGKNAEFLIKEGGDWFLIGDMTFWKAKK